jgi:hypothetical protein
VTFLAAGLETALALVTYAFEANFLVATCFLVDFAATDFDFAGAFF